MQYPNTCDNFDLLRKLNTEGNLRNDKEREQIYNYLLYQAQ